MKFVDTLTITVKSGNGGDGCVSFRREKYVPRGGPDGGNGGDGGSVIFRGDRGKQTLLDLHYKRIYEAAHGARGQGRDKTGRSGEDLIILIPFGTLLYDGDDLLADISEAEPECLVARGGRGGRGNTSFASATHRTPREAEEGTLGEERLIRMELKLIADVGIVGYPNAGKSTFISVVSAARPKVADYPFTTLTPILGVVKNQTGGSFVLADMPGLIDGASEGVGLGHRFLRHIERTRVLLHFVDASLEESMITRYEAIRNELGAYSATVADKEEIVVATKTDSAIEENLSDFGSYIKANNKPFFAISSLTKGGVQELLAWTEKVLAANARTDSEALSDSETA
jgi:GTP-binding protein